MNRTCISERGFFAPGFTQVLVARTEGAARLAGASSVFQPPFRATTHVGSGVVATQTVNEAFTMSNITTLSFETTTFNIIDQHGKSWLRSGQIAEALGYSDQSSINRIYSRRADEFTSTMTGTVKLTDPNGDLQDTRIFSLRGAHLLAMFARTEKAKAFRVWLLDLIEREGSQAPAIPALPATISEQQCQHLQELVQLVVQSGKQTHGETWKRFHNKMRVASYRNLPAAQFESAVAYLKGKLDDETTLCLVGKHLNERMPAAIEMALATASGVFTETLRHVLTYQDPPSVIRLLAAAQYVPGQGMKPSVTPIERDKYVMNDAEWIDHLKERMSRTLMA